jgi:hypothetical protein
MAYIPPFGKNLQQIIQQIRSRIQGLGLGFLPRTTTRKRAPVYSRPTPVRRAPVTARKTITVKPSRRILVPGEKYDFSYKSRRVGIPGERYDFSY